MDKIKLGLGAILVATAVLLTTSAGDVLLRVTQISGETLDVSVVGRIFVPFFIVPRFLLTYPFGVAFYSLPDALSPFLTTSDFSGADIIHNGALNLLFEYGVFGFLIILCIFKVARDNTVRFYILAAANFNGAFLAPDKFSMIVLAVAVYYSARKEVDTSVSSAADPLWKVSGIVGNPVERRFGSSYTIGISRSLRSDSAEL